MGDKTDVWQGTLALMVLKTLATMGAQHGYGLARRIEQTSGGKLTVNYGTIYPALLKLEQEGAIAAEWGASENNRRAKFYTLTRAGRRLLATGRTQLGGHDGDPRPLPRAGACAVRRSGSSERGGGRWRGWAASSGTAPASESWPPRSRATSRCTSTTTCAAASRRTRPGARRASPWEGKR